MQLDLSLLWDSRGENNIEKRLQSLDTGADSAQAACTKAHALAVISEDAFTTQNFSNIYEQMEKPAFVFDGRKYWTCKNNCESSVLIVSRIGTPQY